VQKNLSKITKKAEGRGQRAKGKREEREKEL
jgi:hypothetical protein